MITETCGISSYIEKKALNSSAVVHSVYERTVNISLSNGGMLAIQKESSPVSPLTLSVEGDSPVFLASEGIAPGMPVRLKGGNNSSLKSIDIGDITIHISKDAPRFDTEVPPASDPASYLSFEHHIPKESDDLIRKHADRIKKEAKELFRNSDPVRAAHCLAGLLGLGKGLTPSGDDFLCGFITGIHSVSTQPETTDQNTTCLRDALFDEIIRRSDNTNDISLALLRASMDGHTSLPLKNFLLSPSAKAIDDISRIGHTSGMDALEGLLCFFSIL